jgi:D-lactate dehydrogenase
MHILYIRPRGLESSIITAQLAKENEVHFAENVAEVSESILKKVEILCIFVDTQVHKEMLIQMPNLRAIVTRSAGYDHIDLAYVKEHQLILSRVPHYGTRTVAEFAFGLIFALSRNIVRAVYDFRENKNLNLTVYEGFDLSQKTLGVFGTGMIGAEVVKIGQKLDMKVIATDVFERPELIAQGLTYVSKDELLCNADIVSLHVPSLPGTHHLMDAEAFGHMKSGSLLINTSRGDIVDTHALLDALENGTIAGAGLDVLEDEHTFTHADITSTQMDEQRKALYEANNKLCARENVIVTPHIAFNTHEAKKEILDITLRNIQAVIAGTPENTVNIS